MTIPEMKTIDGYPITDGMKVWDYDVKRGTTDLSKMTDEILGDSYRTPDPIGQYWFEVITDDGGKKLMSDTRVWLYHPFTKEKA